MAHDVDFDAVDAIAEEFRQGMLDLVLLVTEKPQYRAASSAERVEAHIAGLLSGLAESMVASMEPDGHAELRAVLLQYLPQYIDDARMRLGLSPLGALH
jgi:predicted Zn-dependent protease with MMP-like domain